MDFLKKGARSRGESSVATEPLKSRPKTEAASAATPVVAKAAAVVADDEDDTKPTNAEIIIARASAEALRRIRFMSAVIYYTWVFPTGILAEALVAAGQQYELEYKTPKGQKNKKMEYPACCLKWCALVSTIVEMKVDIEEKFERQRDDALAVVNGHVATIVKPTDLDCVQLHCESRMTHDDSECILILAAPHCAGVVDAIKILMFLFFKLHPKAGPAPAGKAERKALQVANRKK